VVNRIISAAQKMQSFGCNLYEFDPGGNVREGVSGYRPYDVAIWTLPPNLGTVLSPTPLRTVRILSCVWLMRL